MSLITRIAICFSARRDIGCRWWGALEFGSLRAHRVRDLPFLLGGPGSWIVRPKTGSGTAGSGFLRGVGGHWPPVRDGYGRLRVRGNLPAVRRFRCMAGLSRRPFSRRPTWQRGDAAASAARRPHLGHACATGHVLCADRDYHFGVAGARLETHGSHTANASAARMAFSDRTGLSGTGPARWHCSGRHTHLRVSPPGRWWNRSKFGMSRTGCDFASLKLRSRPRLADQASPVPV